MKPYFLFIIAGLLICSFTATAQTSAVTNTDTVRRAQSVYVELFGAGLTVSANYDTRFSKSRDGFGGRVGIGYLDDDGIRVTTVPIQINYLAGKNGKYFEVGFGATIADIKGKGYADDDWLGFDGSSSSVIGTMTFGYRYQPIGGGFNFRGAITPVFNNQKFIPYFFGISLGYTFKN